jgi:enoyl-CoA hydratase/carnithine racemase
MVETQAGVGVARIFLNRAEKANALTSACVGKRREKLSGLRDEPAFHRAQRGRIRAVVRRREYNG